MQKLSTELQVSKQTPPIFLFHTSEDTGVPPQNSILFYLACHKAGVPIEMHIYEKGPHGVGLGWSDYALGTWPARLGDWLLDDPDVSDCIFEEGLAAILAGLRPRPGE